MEEGRLYSRHPLALRFDLMAIGFEWAFLAATEHHQAGRLREAEEMYRQVLAQRPDHPETLQRLGVLLGRTGRFEEGRELLLRAIRENPTRADFSLDMGLMYEREGRNEEAMGCFQEALRRRPNYVAAHHSLGIAFLGLKRVEEAIGSFQRAIQLKPEWALPHGNIGVAYAAQGRLKEAEASYRRAVALNPRHAQAQSNLIYTLHLDPTCGDAELAEELRRFRVDFERFDPAKAAHGNERDPGRRLKIGYVSADLRSHAVGRFMLPLLEAHDREAVEVICFTDVKRGDAMAEELRAHADKWVCIAGMSDDEAATAIRAEGIDVLVDLSVHTSGNRLLVFARKPAPVQVTYLGYCSTTGMSAVDYRLSDSYLDPVGEEAGYYSEKTVRLAGTYWCYGAPAEAPEVNELPAKGNGVVTWGCLNNFSKVTEEALQAWGRLMLEVPGSRLILHADEGGHRGRLREVFGTLGIGMERVEFVGYSPLKEYFGVYQQIDIALDTFPYAGGTTTCDALWMGVPVVTMKGKRAVGRGGVSLLSHVGLGELVALDEGEYVAKAVGLAGDLGRLAEMRRGLRERMKSSVVMDARGFAKDVEGAYRGMWRRWCEKEGR